MREKFDREQAFDYLLHNPTKGIKNVSKDLGVSQSLAYNLKKEFAHSVKQKFLETLDIKRQLNASRITIADLQRSLKSTEEKLENTKNRLANIEEIKDEEFRGKEIVWNNKIRELMGNETIDQYDHLTDKKLTDEQKVQLMDIANLELNEIKPVTKSDVVVGVIVGAIVGASMATYAFLTNGVI